MAKNPERVPNEHPLLRWLREQISPLCWPLPVGSRIDVERAQAAKARYGWVAGDDDHTWYLVDITEEGQAHVVGYYDDWALQQRDGPEPEAACRAAILAEHLVTFPGVRPPLWLYV